MKPASRLPLIALLSAGALTLSGCGLLPGWAEEEPTPAPTVTETVDAEPGEGAEEAEPSESESSDEGGDADRDDDRGDDRGGDREDDRGDDADRDRDDERDDDNRSSGLTLDSAPIENGEPLPAEDVLPAALEKAKAADSVLVRITAPLPGGGDIDSRMITVQGPLDGSEAEGLLFETVDGQTASVKILSVDGDAYIQPYGSEGTDTYEGYRLLQGKWVPIPLSEITPPEMVDAGAALDFVLAPLEELTAAEFRQFEGVVQESSVHDGEVVRYRLPGDGGEVVIDPDGNISNISYEREGGGATRGIVAALEDWGDVDPVEAPRDSMIAD